MVKAWKAWRYARAVEMVLEGIARVEVTNRCWYEQLRRVQTGEHLWLNCYQHDARWICC